jgi:hypothetical protein
MRHHDDKLVKRLAKDMLTLIKRAERKLDGQIALVQRWEKEKLEPSSWNIVDGVKVRHISIGRCDDNRDIAMELAKGFMDDKYDFEKALEKIPRYKR